MSKFDNFDYFYNKLKRLKGFNISIKNPYSMSMSIKFRVYLEIHLVKQEEENFFKFYVSDIWTCLLKVSRVNKNLGVRETHSPRFLPIIEKANRLLVKLLNDNIRQKESFGFRLDNVPYCTMESPVVYWYRNTC